MHYTNYTTPYNSIALQHATSSSCRWGDTATSPIQKTQLQPPFSPSVGSLCHPWITATNLPYRFPILKLPHTSATALCATNGRWFQDVPITEKLAANSTYSDQCTALINLGGQCGTMCQQGRPHSRPPLTEMRKGDASSLFPRLGRFSTDALSSVHLDALHLA